jgi:hypothetical protein
MYILVFSPKDSGRTAENEVTHIGGLFMWAPLLAAAMDRI